MQMAEAERRRDFGWPAALACLGLLGGGWFVGHGFEAGRSTDRTLMRSASQGLFHILPRDEAPGIMEAGQVEKKVRVVSAIEYLLAD